MLDKQMTNPAKPASLDPLTAFNPIAASFGNVMTAWPEYVVDAFQRSVLFLEILRGRGDEQASMASRPMATVLRFDHEILSTAYRKLRRR